MEKSRRKNPPKTPGKIQIRIWELRGQSPHCKDVPLTISCHFLADFRLPAPILTLPRLGPAESSEAPLDYGMLQGWGLEGWGLGLAEAAAKVFHIIKNLAKLPLCIWASAS